LDRLFPFLDVVSHGGGGRAPDLELGDHAIDALDVGVNGAALVATYANGKRDVEQVLRYVVLQVEAMPRAIFDCGDLVRLRRHVVGHDTSMPRSRANAQTPGRPSLVLHATRPR